ncbi:MAG: guanine deaminase [Pseudomonadota bacterium]
MGEERLYIGQMLFFDADPFVAPVSDATRHDARGALLVRDGRIAALGTADDLRAACPRVPVTDFGRKLIVPGFVDAHAHYPQTAIVASWGKRLIDWLNVYTFPEEMRFGDPVYARALAERYLDLLLDHGTTAVCTYATVHPESVHAFFAAAAVRNMRVLAGKTCMDRNAPDGLRDTAQSAYDDSAKLAEAWHGRGRASYVLTPRFSPTSTPGQLEALGALWAKRPELPMQTHIAEQAEEIAWVRALFPDAKDYLDTYERFGLLGPGAIFGHAIHLEARERDAIREAGAALVHCPTSNTFIGSGLFDTARMKRQGQIVGLATDTGGGSSFSMLRTMAAAYEIGQLNGAALHPAQLLWLATEGSAAALGLDGVIGTLREGAEADLTVLDLASTPAIAQRAARANDIWEALFPTIVMGDDRAVAAVVVAGVPRRGG